MKELIGIVTSERLGLEYMPMSLKLHESLQAYIAVRYWLELSLMIRAL